MDAVGDDEEEEEGGISHCTFLNLFKGLRVAYYCISFGIHQNLCCGNGSLVVTPFPDEKIEALGDEEICLHRLNC